MKTTITAGGTLYVTPDSDLEAYALEQWATRNLVFHTRAGEEPRPNMIIDTSEFPSGMTPSPRHPERAA